MITFRYACVATGMVFLSVFSPVNRRSLAVRAANWQSERFSPMLEQIPD